jgi:hypothetical protein
MQQYIRNGLLLLLITFGGTQLQADETVPDQMQLRLGGYLLADQATDILVTKHGLGATINLQDLFKMEEQTQVFRLDGFYRFTPKHSVEFSWYSIKNSSKSDEDINFEWGDENISANGALDTHFNTDIYKVNYVYSFYDSEQMEAGISAGLHVTTIDVGFSGSYNVDGNISDSPSEEIRTTAPLPVIGFRLKYNIMPKLSVKYSADKYSADYFFITYENIQGAMSDVLLTLDYRFTDHLGAGIGFNSTRMRLKYEEDDYNLYLQHDVSGGLVYATLTF